MKVNRHAKIVELINKYQIETQDELAEYLNEAGFKVTQATVSRDIRDLKLTKVPAENGRQKYAVLQSAQNGMTEKYVRILPFIRSCRRRHLNQALILLYKALIKPCRQWDRHLFCI